MSVDIHTTAMGDKKITTVYLSSSLSSSSMQRLKIKVTLSTTSTHRCRLNPYNMQDADKAHSVQ